VKLFRPADAPQWLEGVLRSIERAFRDARDAPVRLPEYAVAELPDAADWRGGQINVSDEAGGYVPAFSDGTDWLRVTDRAVVS